VVFFVVFAHNRLIYVKNKAIFKI